MENKLNISVPGAILRGLLVGAAAGAAVLLLFGLVGGSWLIGGLAGLCCLVGGTICGCAWFYLKAVEQFYREHPELRPKPEEDGEKPHENS